MIASACMTWESENPAALADFYRRALGWRIRFEMENWIELEGPNSFRLALRRASSPALQAGRGQIGLEASGPLRSTALELQRAGASVDEQSKADMEAGVATLGFRDPEGNRGYLWRRLEREGDSGAS